MAYLQAPLQSRKTLKRIGEVGPGPGTGFALPLKKLFTAQAVVEQLENDRKELHLLYSGSAGFYPLKR